MGKWLQHVQCEHSGGSNAVYAAWNHQRAVCRLAWQQRAVCSGITSVQQVGMAAVCAVVCVHSMCSLAWQQCASVCSL